MVLVVDAVNATATASTLQALGQEVHTIGMIAPRADGAAVLVN
jgi:phosphoribosylformylglycinamidine cyclo-ligase